MTRSSTRRALLSLARAHGIQTGYLTSDGHRRIASDEVLVSVLRALGTELRHPEDADAELRALESVRARRPVAPVLAHRQGEVLDASVVLPHNPEPEEVWISIRSESGAVSRINSGDVELSRKASRYIDGAEVTLARLRIPVQLPVGYHRLEIDGPGLNGSALVVSAPGRAPRPERAWGAFMPVHALRTASDWGSGSFGDLGSLCEWIGEMGGGFVGCLPVNATFSGVPFADPSPYRPASRLAWNESYVDLESIPDVAACDRARELMCSPKLAESLGGLRKALRADPEAVAAQKRRILEALASCVWSSRSARREQLESFIDSRPESVPFARFMARCEERARPFWEWPAAEVAQSAHGAEKAGELEPRVLTHLYAQWIADEQLARAGSRGAGLYLDVPVGVHPAGFDPWYEPESFVEGVSGGAPPDAFFSEGQVWGFPPMHPHGARDSEYRHFVAVLRHVMRHASVVRLDHIMGLHRMYWVPDGAGARDGVYVRYRAKELYAVICVEAHRSSTTVVGEDLGTVPGSVRRAMDRDGLAHSFVFEFASRYSDPLPTPPQCSLASLSTHDLPTFGAYWRGLDIEERVGPDQLDRPHARALVCERARWRRAVLEKLEDPGPGEAPTTSDVSTEQALAGCLGHLAAGPAGLVMVDLEDLWGETDPQNRPGSGAGAGNFLRRARRTLEEVRSDPFAAHLLGQVNRLRRTAHNADGGARTGRATPASAAAATGGNR